MRLRSIVAVLLGLAGPALASPASADGVLEPIRLVYRAAPGCPGEADFVAKVRRAAPRMQVTEGGGPAVRVFTILVGEDGGLRGRLTIASNRGTDGARDVVGSRCEEVADLLAFATALAVDPTLGDAGSEPMLPSSPPPAYPRAEAPRRATTGRESFWGFALHALIAGANAPSPTFGGGASIERAWRAGGLFPSLRLGAEAGTSAPASADGAQVTFSRALALIEACPTRWGGRGASFRICARAEVGERTAAARDIPAARTIIRVWAAVAPTAHLRLGALGTVFADLGGELVIPLVRDRAYFAPDVVVYPVPSVAAAGEVALGAEFP